VIEDVPQARPAAAGELPVPPMPIVGPEREVAAVADLLSRDEVRLVTLTGPGGSGKTRLGLEVAARTSGNFPGGVCFVGLASVVDADSVLRSIAQHFAVRHTGDRPLIDVLVESLKLSLRNRTLLFLDNFEHVMDAAAAVTRMLESSALLQILVTSRAVLRLCGEHEYPVPPLPLPDLADASLEAFSRSPAVQLFVQRASAVVPDFALTRDQAMPVAQICARVDGLPLASELAAARIKMFTPAAIRARLEKGLDFLSRGPSDVPVRQQTLRKTVDWSYDLLSAREQKLFQRLSVFRAGWTLEAAEGEKAFALVARTAWIALTCSPTCSTGPLGASAGASAAAAAGGGTISPVTARVSGTRTISSLGSTSAGFAAESFAAGAAAETPGDTRAEPDGLVAARRWVIPWRPRSRPQTTRRVPMRPPVRVAVMSAQASLLLRRRRRT